jgi:hypothetical protein
MGAILVVIVVGLLGMVDRTERATSRRQRDMATLAQMHEVMDRTFGTLVMLDATNGKPDPASRPRMVLEAAGSEHGPRPPLSNLPLQRLEVVLEKSPVPPGWGGGPMIDTSYANQNDDIRATRGVFEIRAGKGKEKAADGTWSLWWRPLPPTIEGPNAKIYREDPTRDDRAVLIADGLTECQWMAFKNRERASAVTVNRFDDLPAYMEMQVATASGLSANWMFEVQWSNGPETGVEADAMAAAKDAMALALGAAGPAGTTGATGATGVVAGVAGAAPVAPLATQGAMKPTQAVTGARTIGAKPRIDKGLGIQSINKAPPE